jgi:MFS family permease
VSCAVFSLFCFLIGIVPHFSAVWIGRFVTGFTSAVPAVVTAGSIQDMFDGKQRVWLVVVWNAGSTAGLCLGPVYGTYLLSALGWRWVFHISAIITAFSFRHRILFSVSSRRQRKQTQPDPEAQAHHTRSLGCAKPRLV